MCVLVFFALIAASWPYCTQTLLFAAPWAGWQLRSFQVAVSKGASFPVIYIKNIIPLNTSPQVLPSTEKDPSFISSSPTYLWIPLPICGSSEPPTNHLGLSLPLLTGSRTWMQFSKVFWNSLYPGTSTPFMKELACCSLSETCLEYSTCQAFAVMPM